MIVLEMYAMACVIFQQTWLTFGGKPVCLLSFAYDALRVCTECILPCAGGSR